MSCALGVSQIARRLCEGWSAIGSWQGTQLEFLKHISAGHARQIHLVQVRGGLHKHHRYGERAASTDADDI